MKIWNSYGSEHSANLIMIGKFKDAGVAERAKEVIDEITEFVGKTGENERQSNRYSDDAFELLRKVKLYSVGPAELVWWEMGESPPIRKQLEAEGRRFRMARAWRQLCVCAYMAEGGAEARS